MTDHLISRLDETDRLAEAATEGPWEEAWLPVPEYDGYEVSDFGNVRSYYLKGNNKRKRAKYPRTLKTVLNREGGYPTVHLKGSDERYKRWYVHHLVLLAFVGQCPEGKEVAHLNGDSTDPRLANLSYVSHKENESHKLLHGTSGHGERNSLARLQGWQVEEIKYLASKSVPQAKIAALFDVKLSYVNDILSGKTWLTTSARTELPALNRAVRAVLELHAPFSDEQTLCSRCTDSEASWERGDVEHPCPTVQAIYDAMGEDDE